MGPRRIRHEMRRRTLPIVSLVLALGLLAWVLRDVSGHELASILMGADAGWLALAVGGAIAPFGARVLRWRAVLGRGAELGLGPLWHATVVGFMANNLLPARLGEWVRAVLARELAGVPIAEAVASIVVVRLLDALCLIAILIAAIAGGWVGSAADPATGSSLETMALSSAVVLSAIGAGLAALVFAPRALRDGVGDLLSRAIPARWRAPLEGIARSALEGLAVLRRPAAVGQALAWTAVIWSVNVVTFWAAARALGLDLGWAPAFVTQSVVAVGIAIVPTPGFFGSFEAAASLYLGAQGFDAARVSAYAITAHLCFFVPFTLLGLVSLARLRLRPLHLRERALAASQAPTGPRD